MTEQQQPKISKEELDVLKKHFKDNEYLLKAMRALFFGLTISNADKDLIKKTFADEELFKTVSGRLYPELDADSPIGMLQDIWLGAEGMVFGATRDTIEQAIQYKDKSRSMVKQALGLLRDPDAEAPRVRYEPAEVVDDPLGIELLARNQYLRHIESQLSFFMIIADTHEPNAKEIEARAKKDSSK